MTPAIRRQRLSFSNVGNDTLEIVFLGRALFNFKTLIYFYSLLSSVLCFNTHTIYNRYFVTTLTSSRCNFETTDGFYGTKFDKYS